MKLVPTSKPSPIRPDWLFVDGIRPSDTADEYDNDNAGAGPAGTCGTRIGYAHVNAPVAPDVPHVDDSASGVADQSPSGPATPDVIATDPPDDPVDDVVVAVIARSIAGADPPDEAGFTGTVTLTVWAAS